jgi:lipoyl(octanoyl) transferase
MVAPQQLGSFEALPISEVERQERKILWEDWTRNDPVDFNWAWDVQRDYLEQHMSRLGKTVKDAENAKSSFLVNEKMDGCDRIIMLEHDAVYTLGTASDPSFVLDESTTIPVVRMDRGGEVTYHGPGQLTVYPVLDLRNYQQDIHWYVRSLEEAVLLALRMCLEDNGGDAVALRQDEFTGVWVRDFGKIAAVGVKCRRWVTQHGVAINVDSTCLPPFGGIVPCGLTGPKAQVTCVNDIVQNPVTVSDMAVYMKQAIEQVFAVRLVKS